MSITMLTLLGFAPPPEPKKKAKGRVHTADGKPPKEIHKRTDRSEAIAKRWEAIEALCRIEPTTMVELKEALGFREGTLADDLKKMVAAGRLKSREHRRENVYWVSA